MRGVGIISQEEFIKIIIANHGDIYSFEKLVYKGSQENVTLICKKHNCDITVKAYTLLRRTNANGGKKKVPIVGSCPMCRIEYFAGIKKEMFDKFKKAHNNEYEYDEDSYVNTRKQFYAICKIHGKFKITADVHKRGGGKCPDCYPPRMHPNHKIIDNQNYYVCDIHGDVPIGKKRKLSRGCPTCNKIKLEKRNSEVSKAAILRKYKGYDIVFDDNDNIIKLICKKHGTVLTDFKNKGNTKHLCDDCRQDAINENLKKQEEIANKAKIENIKIIKKIIAEEYNVQYDFLEFIDLGIFIKCKVKLYNKLTNKEKIVYAQSIFLKALSKNHRYVLRNYLSFEDAKKRVRELGIQTLREYQKWYKRTKQTELPSNPFRHYSPEFTTYCDFFGTNPKKTMSYGEKRIDAYLTRKGIKYIYQKRFKDCKNKVALPFDFYLPEYNTLIEFDGMQHYNMVNKYGIKAFEHTQKTDAIKNQYCKDKNINLIRIHFDELNDNTIEWTLDLELSKIGANLAAMELSNS